MRNYLLDEILYNGLTLYDYLSLYGNDKYNTKEDLILLILIKDIFELENNYTILCEKSFNALLKRVDCILSNNPVLKYYNCNKCKDNCSFNDFLLSLSPVWIDEEEKFNVLDEQGSSWLLLI